MTRYHHVRSDQQPPSRSGRLARLMIFIGVTLVALWLAVSIFRLVNAGQSLFEQQQRIETLMEAGILDADPQELEQLVVTIREDIAEINAVARPMAGVSSLFSWLPGVGPLLSDSEHLLDMADGGSEAALHAFIALKPLLATNHEIGGTGIESLPRVIAVLEANKPHLARADEAAGRMFEAREALSEEEEYPDRVAGLLTRLDENSGLIRDGLKLAQIAPELLGYERPRTYLIIAQNEDELRPTGGFISGAGLLTVDQGQIVGLSFDNANLVDDWQNKPYDLPPDPYTEFMGMDIFLFRDANFWPDFAKSAAQAMALYSYGQDVPLDGAIAIDQQFLRRLLATTGPLSVPELERIVDANNVITQLREEWGPGDGSEDWIINRKAFMAPLANAVLTNLRAGLLATSGLELIEMLETAAQERHLQVYSSDPAAAEILDQTAWNGRMTHGANGDYLHVSDTNMGFNKVNAVVTRSLVYDVALDDSGGPAARLDVRYSNPPAEDIECLHGTQYNPDTQYESLVADCFWNYLRVYAPDGSELLWASDHPVSAENLMSGRPWSGISRTAGSTSGLAVFDNFILTGPGHDTTVSFHYALPDTVIVRDGSWYNYRLVVRKQAGMAAENALVRVAIPDGARITKVQPRPASIANNVLLFDLDLATDATIDVTYTN